MWISKDKYWRLTDRLSALEDRIMVLERGATFSIPKYNAIVHYSCQEYATIPIKNVVQQLMSINHLGLSYRAPESGGVIVEKNVKDV